METLPGKMMQEWEHYQESYKDGGTAGSGRGVGTNQCHALCPVPCALCKGDAH